MSNKFSRWLFAQPKPGMSAAPETELQEDGGSAYRTKWKEVPVKETADPNTAPLWEPTRHRRFRLRATFLVMVLTALFWTVWHFTVSAVPSVGLPSWAVAGQYDLLAVPRWWDILGLGIFTWLAVQFLNVKQLPTTIARAWWNLSLMEMLVEEFEQLILAREKKEGEEEPASPDLSWKQTLCFSLAIPVFLASSLWFSYQYGFLLGVIIGLSAFGVTYIATGTIQIAWGVVSVVCLLILVVLFHVLKFVVTGLWEVLADIIKMIFVAISTKVRTFFHELFVK